MLAFTRAGVRVVSLVLLGLMVVTPLAQIVMRGIFNVPLAGAEELARYFLIAMTFIAAAYVTREGGQIRMEEFQALLPPRPRWLLQLVIELAGVAMFATLLVAGLVTIGKNLDSETAVLQLPFWLFMGPLVVGSFLLVIETAAMFVHTLRRGRPEDKQTVLT
jgi:TRAP-type C4-dicarboxylate transport system permease small subunit